MIGDEGTENTSVRKLSFKTPKLMRDGGLFLPSDSMLLYLGGSASPCGFFTTTYSTYETTTDELLRMVR